MIYDLTHLAKLWMCPGHFPHGTVVGFPGCAAVPVAGLVLVPDLHLLVAGARRHPLAVEVVRHVVDQILVVCVYTFGHIHCVFCLRCSTRLYLYFCNKIFDLRYDLSMMYLCYVTSSDYFDIF